VLDGNGTPLQRSHGPFAIKEIKIKQGLAIDPIYIAILITLAAGPAKKETWCARIKIPPGMLSLFQLIGRPNIITTGYSFCSRARIISETPKTSTPRSSTTILESPKDQRPSKRIVTKPVQYTTDIPYAYLQKFEEPYKFYNASLHIEKKTLPTNEPAITLSPHPLVSSIN
jgi:hypothetical protein